MVPPDLINAEGDRLFLARVLALDDQHWDTVDEKDDILARSIVAVVNCPFLRDLVDVAPLFTRAREVAVVDQDQVELSVVVSIEKLRIVA